VSGVHYTSLDLVVSSKIFFRIGRNFRNAYNPLIRNAFMPFTRFLHFRQRSIRSRSPLPRSSYCNILCPEWEHVFVFILKKESRPPSRNSSKEDAMTGRGDDDGAYAEAGKEGKADAKARGGREASRRCRACAGFRRRRSRRRTSCSCSKARATGRSSTCSGDTRIRTPAASLR